MGGGEREIIVYVNITIYDKHKIFQQLTVPNKTAKTVSDSFLLGSIMLQVTTGSPYIVVALLYTYAETLAVACAS